MEGNKGPYCIPAYSVHIYGLSLTQIRSGSAPVRIMTRRPDLGSLVVTLTPHHLFHLLALISDLVVYAGVLRTRLSKFIFLTCSAAFLVRTEDDHVRGIPIYHYCVFYYTMGPPCQLLSCARICTFITWSPYGTLTDRRAYLQRHVSLCCCAYCTSRMLRCAFSHGVVAPINGPSFP
jgi:hypothetical protein